MERCAIVVLLLVACLGGVRALDDDEGRSLQIILNSFPLLLAVNPMDQYFDLNGEDLDYGGSWTKPMSEVCVGGDGWHIHGVHCVGGHVDELRFSNSWGRSPDLLPLNLTGLQWLSRFTFDTQLGPGIRPNKESAILLMEGVFPLASLKRVSIKWNLPSYFPSSAFQLANLTHVQISMPLGPSVPSMNPFSYLEEVVLSYSLPFSQFLPSASSLRHLEMNGNVLDFNGISNLTKLESLAFNAEFGPILPAFEEIIQIPPSLRFLTVGGWPGSNLSLGNEFSGLESLSISGTELLTRIEYLPPSIKSISLRSVVQISHWPDWSSECALESFSMEQSGTLLPEGLAFCTSLKNIRLAYLTPDILDSLLQINLTEAPLESLAIESAAAWPAEETLAIAQDWICTLSPSSLRILSLSYTKFVQLPACMSQFTALEELHLRHIKNSNSSYRLTGVSSRLRVLVVSASFLGISEGNNSGWTTLVTQFPCLILLDVQEPSEVKPALLFPGLHLMNLTFLKELRLFSLNMSGSLPFNFLEMCSNLTILILNVNRLNGTIPSSGWANLENFNVADNEFTEWPYLTAPGAPNLRTLTISGNPLRSIPGDASFLNLMPKLRLFRAKGIRAQQPVPAFWNNGLQKLSDLSISVSLFQGLLTPMNSPYLRVLDVSHNQLCGPLPEVTGLMGLSQLYLAENQFIGPIPSSWGSHLAIYSTLDLRDNNVGGELPFPLLHPHGVPSLDTLLLSSNYFTGPLTNMSTFVELQSLYLDGENTTWDFCAQNPDFPPSLSECSVALHPSICHCESIYALCAPVTSYCASYPPVTLEPGFDGPIAAPIARLPVVPLSGICITPPGAPSSSVPQPQGSTPGCPPPSPGPSFQCIEGTWKSPGSVTQPILIIPGTTTPGTTTTIIIQGNLTVTEGGVTFNGFESQVVVNGCIFLGENEVIIELTKEELEQLKKEGKVPQTLLTSLTENNCVGSSDLSTTSVTVRKGAGSKGCRKVKAKNSGSTRSSLNVVFQIDNSTCNMIIIIPSVLGALLIITAAATAIGYHLRKARFSLRPGN